jgi:hypothetical protein
LFARGCSRLIRHGASLSRRPDSFPPGNGCPRDAQSALHISGRCSRHRPPWCAGRSYGSLVCLREAGLFARCR